jgi:hypothetical protein
MSTTKVIWTRKLAEVNFNVPSVMLYSRNRDRASRCYNPRLSRGNMLLI